MRRAKQAAIAIGVILFVAFVVLLGIGANTTKSSEGYTGALEALDWLGLAVGATVGLVVLVAVIAWAFDLRQQRAPDSEEPRKPAA